MKTNHKIILTGAIVFAIGILLMAYENIGDPNFTISVDVELLIIFGLITPGLIIAGIGVMLEYAKQKYEVEK